jgi:hypothetical protein
MTWLYAVALLCIGGALGFCVGAFLAICAEDAREERRKGKS